MPRTLRMYEPIWLQLKAKGHAKVAAPTHAHARIKKAVHKEKDIDTAYKIQQDIEGRRMKLTMVSKGNIIEFKLKPSGLRAEDL